MVRSNGPAGRVVRMVCGLALLAAASLSAVASTSAPAAAATPFKGVAGLNCSTASALKTAWWYDWWINPGGCTAAGFVPMVPGKNQNAGDVAWAYNQMVSGGYSTVLGFNEPNKADQANLTVAQAIAMWPTMTANRAVRVGSPATSADGKAWFTDFMSQVQAKNLRVDFIALHWYGWNAGSCDANASSFESYLRWAESLPGNRPIWITEMGCMNQSAPDDATVQRFYSAAAAVIARHTRVERYAWYPYNTHNALTTSTGALTPLGQLFAAAPATR